ncbi:VIT domain-containing protein [Cocleimonas sp. KMM 6892]|uniref:VIT and vWA domain-containing protein n=1 Tax=unclassified Cocleimonas TaxID=2639732 RepID=UPI002DB6AEC9|nr:MULTISPECIES: VIT domain-containing protein [unclassified Cocleimonas]MEB8433270.1 VIT domain-containing protein [Cocleimonas sp. KMM 6892]MEC4715749.1 VIT domain-containing protein [Cocleimonas sp. KMM 6895]MEC4745210.1 VIT domain-containing protein [Cocleimonas sp. KMM 6896]
MKAQTTNNFAQKLKLKFKKTFKKILKNTLAVATLGIVLLGATTSVMAAGLMTPVDSSKPALSIKSHHVNVTIEDGYAVTEVDQTFSNPHQQDLEATYSFPVPEKGVVSEFTIWIDGKPVIGEVLEKQKAQQLYEEEKAAGRDAGLTTKVKHYRFEVKVSPVRAQQDARIRLVYMQAADIDNSMGRYVYPLEEGETDDQANAFWSYDPVVKEDFSFNVNLRSGYPVNGVRLPQHSQAVVTQSNPQEWSVSLGSNNSVETLKQTHVEEVVTPTQESTGTLAEDLIKAIKNKPISNNEIAALESGETTTSNTSTAAATLDKDIVMYWRLAPNLPGSIDLVTHREQGAKRGTFMMTLTPGDDLAKIEEGRDWAFVLDMSGSMSGKYQTMVDGVQRAIGGLNAQDRFQIILFDNAVEDLTQSTWINATPENVIHWSNALAATGPRGGTNIYAGLSKALNNLDADRTGAIILVTDGEANVGVTEKKEFLKLMTGHDVRLFTAVMGNGANRPLLNAMTEVSNGFAVSVSNSDDISGKIREFTSKVTHQAMHDVELDISGIKTGDMTPEKITSLYRGQQLVVFGHYWGSGDADVELKAKVSGENKSYKTRFAFPENETSNPEIERLWAYAKIQDLKKQIDYLGSDADFKSAVIDIAVENSLVTDYTSMIVMRDEQFEAHGIERKNKARVAKEQTAKTQRAQAPVQSRRADTSQPAFTSNRSSHGGGGGGAFNPLMLLPFVVFAVYRRRKGGFIEDK